MCQGPENFGLNHSRWTLELLRQTCPALAHIQTPSGVWKCLQRHGLVYKRGRRHLHSPDPLYEHKIRIIEELVAQALESPQEIGVLYADEKTIYRQPVEAPAWSAKGSGGRTQALAELSCRSNTKWRLGGMMDVATGQVVWHGASKMGADGLCRLLEKVRKAWPEPKRLIVVWDNWPVHSIEAVTKRAQKLGIELVYLPTYAPWANPIEKLWRWLSEQVLRMHRHSETWDELKSAAHNFLDQFASASEPLLCYVGLLPKTTGKT